MGEATQDSRTVGTRRFALLLLALAAVALLPALVLLAPHHGLRLRHPGLLAMLFAFGICAYRAEVHLKTKVPLKVDGGYALVLVAVALSGPLAGLIVFLPWDVASRFIWREHKVFTSGVLANFTSYGWSALAASEVLRLAGGATLAPRGATGLFAAGMAMGVVQFAIARVAYATLYQGQRAWPLLRGEFPDFTTLILADVLLGTLTAVLFGAVGIPAFAILALVILVPSLLFPALTRHHSVTQLDQGAAAALYATALVDVMRLTRDRRRVVAGAAHLVHHSKHARNARWSDLHDIEFTARYAGEHYDGSGGPAALEERREAVIDVKIDAFIPNDYIGQVSQKIAIYQQLAKARTQEEVEEVAAGVRDRFGAFPEPLANLVELTKLRAVALRKRVTRVVVDERRLTLGVGSGFELDPAAVPKLQALTKNRFRFTDGRILVDLPGGPNWMPLLRKLLEAL